MRIAPFAHRLSVRLEALVIRKPAASIEDPKGVKRCPLPELTQAK